MDTMQTGIEWVELRKLKQLRIYPSILKDCFDEHDLLPRENIFLGDIN
jgi:hypothetical protein